MTQTFTQSPDFTAKQLKEEEKIPFFEKIVCDFGQARVNIRPKVPQPNQRLAAAVLDLHPACRRLGGRPPAALPGRPHSEGGSAAARKEGCGGSAGGGPRAWRGGRAASGGWVVVW